MKPTPTPPSPAEEFRYGWRYVKQTLPDGRETLIEVPLTLEDVLHPQEGDVILENTQHDADCIYLATVFRSRPLSPPVALVTRDCGVEWGVPGIRHHSPDVGVFVGLSRDPRPTGMIELRALGGRCELVIEVVSPSTRVNDVETKFDHYFRVGVPMYLIVDQEKEGGPRFLRAYKRKPERYVEIESDDQYRIDIPALGLMIGLRDDRVVCWDLKSGRELGDYSSITRELEEADRRAEQQDQAIEEQIKARQDAERLASDARKEADRQREEADRQRREREEVDRKAADQEKLIRDLQEKLRLLESSGGTPTT